MIRGLKLVEMEVQLGNWSKGQWNSHLCSIGLNKTISKTVYDTARQNAFGASNDIKCPILQSLKTSVSLNMFIEAPMHTLFLGIVKSIMEVSDNCMKQYRVGNKFISHANAYIAQMSSFHLESLQLQTFPNTNYLSEWCLGMAHLFPFLYGKLTTIIEPIIHYGNKYTYMEHCSSDVMASNTS